MRGLVKSSLVLTTPLGKGPLDDPSENMHAAGAAEGRWDLLDFRPPQVEPCHVELSHSRAGQGAARSCRRCHPWLGMGGNRSKLCNAM